MRLGLTYNDVLLVPKKTPLYSRGEADVTTRFTRNISLNIPLVSSNMATVTESRMAIAMARNGGLGVIHQFCSIEEQVEEVKKVKRSTSYVIENPLIVQDDLNIFQAVNIMKAMGVTSLIIMHGDEMVGIFTPRDYLFEDDWNKPVKDVMTKEVVTANYGIGTEEAKKILHEHRIEKLPLMQDGKLRGLITTKDIMKLYTWPNANRDIKGRLRVGAAVGVKDTIERSAALINAGADVIILDVAHAHSEFVLERVREFKKHFNVDLMVGNIATGEAARDLIDAGADGLKIGVGPGCFAAGTRILMANGVYKNIEEIKAGDRVINMLGKPVNVKNAFCTGVKRVMKIRNSIFNEDTFVTPEHNFFIGDLNTSSKLTLQSRGYAYLLEQQSKTRPKISKYKWKEIQNLKQDVLLIPKKIKFEIESDFKIILKKRFGGNWRTGTKYKNDICLKPSYALGYIFGTFLGDGNAHVCCHNGSHIGSVGWTFNVSERNIVDKLCSCVFEVFKKRCNVSSRREKTLEVKFYYKPFADFLSSFGKKEKKNLPEDYLVNHKDYLNGLFDGLVDSDGHVEKCGRICFCNTSKKLIELFGILSFLLGGVFPNSGKRNISVGLFVNAKLENFNQPYISKINTSGEKRLTNDYQAVKLLELSQTSLEVNVYDLEVDCPTHSFIANNVIVHNSACTTRTISGAGVPQLTAVMDACEVARRYDVPVCADGGIKLPGDISKALAAGASSVFCGSLFAGTDEAPGIIMTKDGRRYKRYMGSASYDSNHERKENEQGKRLKEKIDVFVEGVAILVDYKGPVEEVIKAAVKGLQSGISYCGGRDIKEMQQNAEFIQITSNGWDESLTHGTKLSE